MILTTIIFLYLSVSDADNQRKMSELSKKKDDLTTAVHADKELFNTYGQLLSVLTCKAILHILYLFHLCFVLHRHVFRVGFKSHFRQLTCLFEMFMRSSFFNVWYYGHTITGTKRV